MKTIRGKTPARKLQKEFKAQHPARIQLSYFLQDWDDAYNVGGLYRVADGLGVKTLYASGHTPVPPDPMISVTSLGHHRRIEMRQFPSHESAALAAIEDGWTLIAIEIAEGALPYFDYEFPSQTCLVLGNEGNGVYGSVLKHCAAAVYIPMLGKGRSLNVHVSGAIVGAHAMWGGQDAVL